MGPAFWVGLHIAIVENCSVLVPGPYFVLAKPDRNRYWGVTQREILCARLDKILSPIKFQSVTVFPFDPLLLLLENPIVISNNVFDDIFIGLWTNPAPISEMICAIKCIKALAFSRFLVS